MPAGPPIIRVGAKMVVIRRRTHVERFRVTLNGLGGFPYGEFRFDWVRIGNNSELQKQMFL